MKDAQPADEWISQKSGESGIAAIEYIFGEGEETGSAPKKDGGGRIGTERCAGESRSDSHFSITWSG